IGGPRRERSPRRLRRQRVLPNRSALARSGALLRILRRRHRPRPRRRTPDRLDGADRAATPVPRRTAVRPPPPPFQSEGTPMFIVILGTVLGLMHLYLWKRLIKDTVRGRARWVLTVVFLGLLLLLVATLLFPRLFGWREQPWLAWPGYVWFGLVV